MTTKTTKAKAPAKPVANENVKAAFGIMTALLMTKGTSCVAAMEQAKYILENANEHVG